MATTDFGLTLLCLVPLGLALFMSRLAMPAMHQASKTAQEALGELTNRVTEAFLHVHVIQANGVADAFVDRTEAANKTVFATNMRLIRIRNIVFPLTSTLANIAQLVVLFYGGRQILLGKLSVGDLLAFNVYLGLLAFPLTALGMILSLYQRARTALERLSSIDEAVPESANPAFTNAVAATQPPSPPLLTVRHLTFAYDNEPDSPNTSEFRLADIVFDLLPGERLGITGPIGAGKSTLFHLLVRLLEPPAGSIFFAGHDILSLSPQNLRSDVGLALQTPHLFSASIKDNLMFGLDRAPTDEALRVAAHDAEIIGEIERLPDGFDTQIGERGVRLSGGQKQRLALARLFLRTPRLLLLDDPFSALDQTTEHRLLDRLFAARTTLIFASHRLQALNRCDRVLVLAGGQLKRQGAAS